jgi:hypothetical protein
MKQDWQENIPYINKRANQATVQRKELEDFISDLLKKLIEDSSEAYYLHLTDEGARQSFEVKRQLKSKWL